MNNKGFEKITQAIKEVEGSPEVSPNPGEDRKARYLTIGGEFGVRADFMCNVLDVHGLMHHEGDPIITNDNSPRLIYKNSEAGLHFFEDTATSPSR